MDLANPKERNDIGDYAYYAVVCLSVATIALSTPKLRWQRWQLLQTHGQIIDGQVVALRDTDYLRRKQSLTANTALVTYMVWFVFATPTNRRIRRRIESIDPQFYDRVVIGTPVAILYVNDRIFQLL